MPKLTSTPAVNNNTTNHLPTTHLPINEVFETLQGESSYTGTPAVFIRLMGCPVGCVFCDTKHTWQMDNSQLIPVADMLAKQQDSDGFATMDVAGLIKYCQQNFTARHIVITGGEPCLYDLTKLSTAFIDEGFSLQVETSGTFAIKIDDRAFVTLSPKIKQAGGFTVLKSALHRADEIKHVVGKQKDIDELAQYILPHVNNDTLIWLQPMSANKKATKLCIDTAIKNNWRVSIQTHKYIGIR